LAIDWICSSSAKFSSFEDRTDIGVVAQLAEVDLDGCEHPFSNGFRKPGGIEKPADLVLLAVLRAAGPDTGKIDSSFMPPPDICLAYSLWQ